METRMIKKDFIKYKPEDKIREYIVNDSRTRTVKNPPPRPMSVFERLHQPLKYSVNTSQASQQKRKEWKQAFDNLFSEQAPRDFSGKVRSASQPTFQLTELF